MGYHFFNPVPLMKVVEVIDGLRSDPAAGDALMTLTRRMGHTPVRAKDMPGFIVNHAGTVYEKDLGKDTEAIAKRMMWFDPDRTWSKVEPQKP